MFTQALDIFLALEPCPMVRGQRWRLWLLSLLLLCNSFLSKKKKKRASAPPVMKRWRQAVKSLTNQAGAGTKVAW
jgi:hypothetical protein